MTRIVFGPVPSRRLGRSLGVNNIPPKHCSYSCVYCQVGRTPVTTVKRRRFYPWRTVVEEVLKALDALEGSVDYVTFVPDGEPTLDAELGREIRSVKREASVRVAVLTNSSLLHRDDVQADLLEADLVSLKIDACTREVYMRINRPHYSLDLSLVLEGIRKFAREYQGDLITETMLVKGVNDSLEELRGIAGVLRSIEPHKAYVAVPVRPPAEPWVAPPTESVVVEAHEVFSEALGRGRVELLVNPETGEFKTPEDPVGGLLSIISVHPMRLEQVREFLEKRGLDPEGTIKQLLEKGEVKIVCYGGEEFLARILNARRDR